MRSLGAALLLLFGASLSSAAKGQDEADYSQWGGAQTEAEGIARWENGLSRAFFGEAELIENAQSVVTLTAPSRAENDAFVPVSVSLHRDAAGAPITDLYLTVDINPSPLAAHFTIPGNRPLESLDTRVRVNGYTHIRAIAIAQDGKHYMASRWVRSRGAGCSAPPGTDQDEARKTLGDIRFRLSERKDTTAQRDVHMFISHPNNTGMQRDQLTTMLIPPSFITQIDVAFEGAPLLQAETTFTLSENPSFRFRFGKHEHGILSARVTDSDGNTFIRNQTIGHAQ